MKKAIKSGIITFLISWWLLVRVITLVVPMDSTGDPEFDKKEATTKNMVGVTILLSAAALGVLAYRRKLNKTNNQSVERDG